MIHRPDPNWRERESLRYLGAHDGGDLAAVAAIWAEAAGDPELEELLRDLDDGLYAEEGPGADFRVDAARIAGLARRCFPGASLSDGPCGPLTAAEVARRLEAEPEFRRLDASDRLAHARLLTEAAPVPDHLGQPGLDRWLAGLGVTAGPHYRRAFRKAAVLMTMARGQREVRLAAARRATPGAEPRGGTT